MDKLEIPLEILQSRCKIYQYKIFLHSQSLPLLEHHLLKKYIFVAIANFDDEEDLDDSDVSLKDASHQVSLPNQTSTAHENGGLMTAINAENIDEVLNA
jgi:hypothetical protein